MIKLGDKVQDIVTGFKGIVTSRTDYINGCVHFGVSAKMKKDGTIPDSQFFDEERLKVIPGSGLKLKKKIRDGGPQRDMPPASPV